MKKMKTTLVLLLLAGLLNAQYAQIESTGYETFTLPCGDCDVLKTVNYIDKHDEEVIELGFDTWYYLPYDFDAYKGMVFDLNEINYIEYDNHCVSESLTSQKMCKDDLRAEGISK